MIQNSLRQKGAILILTALCLPLLIGFTGFAIDAGNGFVQKSDLQNAADAAAFAGAQVYVEQVKAGNKSPQKSADTAAKQNLNSNIKDTLDTSSLGIRNSASSSTIHYYQVILSKKVRTYFLQCFGIDSYEVAASSVVRIKPPEGSTPFSLFNNLITFQDSLHLVNEKKKVWDGNIVHTKKDATVSINGGGPLDRPDGTTFDPATDKYYDSSISVGLNEPSNSALKKYIESLMIDANKKTLNGQEMSSSDLTSAVTYINGRLSSLKINGPIGTANETKILIVTEGALNVHINQADTVGTLIIFDLSGEQIHIEGTGTMRAIVYAPNGPMLQVNPNGLTFYGNLTSKVVDIQASTGDLHATLNSPTFPGAPASDDYNVDLISSDDSDIL